MGPFIASETVTTADKPWTEFFSHFTKTRARKRRFWRRRAAHRRRKGRIARQDVLCHRYTTTFLRWRSLMSSTQISEQTKLAIKSWTNNAYTVNAQTGAECAGILVLPERLL